MNDTPTCPDCGHGGVFDGMGHESAGYRLHCPQCDAESIV